MPWRDPWEPLFASRNDATPAFDARFQQYGFNRVSQSCELHMAGFEFHVLLGAFVVHPGFKRAGAFHAGKAGEMDANRQHFRAFKDELQRRYLAERSCYTHRSELEADRGRADLN